MTQPISTTGRRFIRLARLRIDNSRVELINAISPGAATVWDAFEKYRLGSPIRLGKDLERLCESLDTIECCSARHWRTNKRTNMLFVAFPKLEGHPLADEPQTLGLLGFVIQITRNRLFARQFSLGALSAHALGRLSDRYDEQPECAPLIVGVTGLASIVLASHLKGEQAIALCLAREDEREDDAFLVGVARRQADSKRLFIDWRTVMPRAWLASEAAEFGDTLRDRLEDGKEIDSLPHLPMRDDYINRGEQA